MGISRLLSTYVCIKAQLHASACKHTYTQTHIYNQKHINVLYYHSYMIMSPIAEALVHTVTPQITLESAQKQP